LHGILPPPCPAPPCYGARSHVSHVHGTFVSAYNLGHTPSTPRPDCLLAGLKFRETPGDYDFDFHCAPAKQFVVSLDAGVEIEVTDGTRRVFPAGTVMLAEDTWGKVNEKKPQRTRVFPSGVLKGLPWISRAPTNG